MDNNNKVIEELKYIVKKSKGYWLDLDIEGKNIYGCRCSKCNVYEVWWIYQLPKYCPNCNSEMETDIEINKKINAFIDEWNNL